MKSTGWQISTRPTPRDCAAYVLAFPVFTSIAAVLPMVFLQWHYVHTSSSRAPARAVAVVLLFGAAIAFVFIFRLFNRHFWALNQTELIGGMTGGIRYPLSSVDKIIVGLPNEMPVPGLNAFSSPALKEIYEARQAGALLVIFQDGVMLPLKLGAMPNGAELMNALVERKQDRVARNYNYSKKEIKLLRGAMPNMLIKKNRKN
jgi:hypothetical protein